MTKECLDKLNKGSRFGCLKEMYANICRTFTFGDPFCFHSKDASVIFPAAAARKRQNADYYILLSYGNFT
jgi:hypothetical protein